LSVSMLFVIVFLAGFGIFSGQAGNNAVAATYYPTTLRSTGVGAALGIGRIGSILGPTVAEFMRPRYTTQQLFLVFATLYYIAQVGMAESLFYFVPKTEGRRGTYVANAAIGLMTLGLVSGALLWAGAPVSVVAGSGGLDDRRELLDRIVVQLPNTAMFAYLYFALQRTGAAPVLALPGHRKREITQFAEISGARALAVPAAARGFDFTAMAAEVIDIRGRLREKMMFGSDHPSLPYERILREWDELGYDQSVMDLVFHANAERVLGL